MADLRIVDAPEILLQDIEDGLKLPTGGFGNYAITMSTISDWLVRYKDLALKSYVDIELYKKADKNKVVSSIGGKTGDVSFVDIKGGLGLGDLADKNEEDVLVDSKLKTWSGRTQDQKNKDQINLSDYKKPTNTHTQALQDAINTNPNRCIHVSSGVYELSSVNIPHSISFMCEQGVVFKRAAGLDIQQSIWASGTAMFESSVQGVSILFFGSPIFDGNNQNQVGRYQEPTGWAVKIQPPASVVSSEVPSLLYMQNPKFINGTMGYLALRGDNINRRYLTKVILDNPVFTDTIFGSGKGDPLTPSPLGWQSDYVRIFDYVHLYASNFDASFSKVGSVGEYAPVAIRGTYYGSDSNTSGECSVFLNGITKIKGLGRSGNKYNDVTNFTDGNGIGAIDIYGNGENLYVQNLIAFDNRNVTLRAKASIKNFIIESITLNNCHRGVQVGPSSTGVAESSVVIGQVVSYGGTVPQLEFTGTKPTDKINQVLVNSFDAFGVFTNPENISTTQNGNLHLRNINRVSIGHTNIESSPICGLTIIDVDFMSGTSIKSSSDYASIATIGLAKLDIDFVDLKSNLSNAVNSQSSSDTTTGEYTFKSGVISSSAGTAFLILQANSKFYGSKLLIKEVTGVSRGFSFHAQSEAYLSNNTCLAVTTPIVSSSARIFETANSWNPTTRYGTVALTTLGRAKRGDVVYNVSPSAGSTVGWICVTGDGTDAGTWKTFGNIAT